MFEIASDVLAGENGEQIGTFVSGLHEFVGDQANQLLRCLESDRFYEQVGTGVQRDEAGSNDADVDAQFAETNIWPIVFYGESGTGKTSLAMTVIENLVAQYRQTDPTMVNLTPPTSITGADFFRRFRAAIETQSVDEFRQRVLDSAGLIIDNLEQLDTKQSSQLELISLIDQMAALGRPVVMTMSVSPQACQALNPRLVSRLSGGLCLPTFPPGRAARFELVNKLALVHQISLTEEAVNWVADRLVVTVPRLNHFFIQLKTEINARSKENKTADLNADKPQLENGIGSVEKPVDVFTLAKVFQREDGDDDKLADLIVKMVAADMHLKPEQLGSQSRKQTIVMARGIAIYLQREMLGTSFLKIGLRFGNRDHSTIMHAYRKIETLINAGDDSPARQTVEQLKSQLNEKFASQLTVMF